MACKDKNKKKAKVESQSKGTRMDQLLEALDQVLSKDHYSDKKKKKKVSK